MCCDWCCRLLCLLQEADKSYKRLSVAQPVGLRHAGYVITVNDVVKVMSPSMLSVVSGELLLLTKLNIAAVWYRLTTDNSFHGF